MHQLRKQGLNIGASRIPGFFPFGEFLGIRLPALRLAGASGQRASPSSSAQIGLPHGDSLYYTGPDSASKRSKSRAFMDQSGVQLLSRDLLPARPKVVARLLQAIRDKRDRSI